VSFEEKLAPELGSVTSEIWHRLSESEILFDAANLMRFESEALYLVSSTGNYQAFQWLKSNSNNFKIEATDVYRSSHLDSTILPLNSETVLVNSVRVNPNNIPKSLMNKNILYFKNVAKISQSEGNFHNNYRSPAAKKLENLGFHTNLKEMSSPWAGMNVLSLDENTVLVESTQEKLAQFLESKGFDVILVRMRHPYTMLGGLHCTTLDLVRDHK
jgi:glycine amidinotransferase/scyllo-inosamine-4-phosphate amidinotransferase 1